MAALPSTCARWCRLLVASLALLALALVGLQCPGPREFRAGVCVRDITPVSPDLADEYEAAFGGPAPVNHTDPIFLAGFGDNRRATDYNDRLWARALVLEGVGGRIAIVSLDLVGYFRAIRS